MDDRSRNASRVVLVFSPAADRTAAALDARSYRSYLRRARSGPVSVDEKRDEFVSWVQQNARAVEDTQVV